MRKNRENKPKKLRIKSSVSSIGVFLLPHRTQYVINAAVKTHGQPDQRWKRKQYESGITTAEITFGNDCAAIVGLRELIQMNKSSQNIKYFFNLLKIIYFVFFILITFIFWSQKKLWLAWTFFYKFMISKNII